MLRTRPSLRRSPCAPHQRSFASEIPADRALSAHPMFAELPPGGLPPIALVHGTWNDKFVIINKPPGLASQELPDAIRKMGVVKSDVKFTFPHRLDKHTEGLMVIALDRFAGSLLSRDLEAGRWVRRYRAILEKPPCCAQMPTTVAPKQCCMALLSASVQLTENGKLARMPVKIASFLARSALDSSDPRDTAWQQREEQQFNASKLPPCALAAPFAGVPNPVPAGLRRRSVSDMHPEAKLCVTTVTLREESDTQVLCDIQPSTGRPHQIRVHLTELGFPVASDPYYNPQWLARQLRMSPEQWGTESSMLLQACELQLPDPFKANPIHVSLPYPSSWPLGLKPQNGKGQ